MQFDIYVKPADANEPQYKSKNESACTSNLICAKIGLLVYRSTDLLLELFRKLVIQMSVFQSPSLQKITISLWGI